MKRIVVSLALLSVTSVPPLFGAAAGLLSGGLGWASLAVGVLGAGNGITGANGGGAGNRLITGVGGTALGVFDPSPGTFYTGQLVIEYPSDLISVAYVGWYGNFAVDPTVPIPPVTADEATGFYDSNGVVYQLQQAANTALNATVSKSGGVLTINFNDPAGVLGNSAGHFNFLDVAFTNISGEPLVWSTVAAGGSSNFFENNAQSTLTCVPDPSYTVPVSCGGSTAPTSFSVIETPEPGAFGATVIGLFALLACLRGRRD